VNLRDVAALTLGAALAFCGTAVARAEDAPALLPLPVTPTAVTRHSVTLANDRRLAYTVTAGRIVLDDKLGQPAAAIFSVAYTLDGTVQATRPVAFLWNGGPGSSSLWLHMGSFAPVRVATNDIGTIVAPSRLVPNESTLQLEPFLQEVREYARGPYATALLRGDSLDEATRKTMVEQLHRYIGLDENYIERADLRIEPTRFEKELLRGRQLTGRLDGRFLGYDLDRNSDAPAYDPTHESGIAAAFVSEFNRYVRDDLHFRTDDRYLPFNYGEIAPAWNFQRDATDVGFAQVFLPNVLPDLAQALTRNPALRVFSANGYFDLATPFFGTEEDLGHLGLDPALRSHISYGYYRSGHMIYLESASRRALRADIETFIRNATRK
jgi:carboxypeptidase C (cathepsin A)